MLAQQPQFQPPPPPQSCPWNPPSGPHGPSSALLDASVDFDIGTHPHLTPRYSQGVAALSRRSRSALAQPSQSAVSQLPSFHSGLLCRQPRHLQAQLGHLGMSSQHCTAQSSLVTRNLRPAKRAGRVKSQSAECTNARACCVNCTRAEAPSTEVTKRPTAFQHLGEGRHRVCEGSSLGLGLQQGGKAHLAGSTSRALDRMALTLR